MNQVTQRAPAQARRTTPVYVPRTDVYETHDAYHFEIELPGADPKGISIDLEKGVLTVAAETSVPAPEGLQLVHEEFAAGTFRRAFRLPDDVDGEAIEAQTKHGLLTVRVPKKAGGTKRIEVRAV